MVVAWRVAYLFIFISTLVIRFAGFANASVITYTATLSGLNESPVNASPGTGEAMLRSTLVTALFGPISAAINPGLMLKQLETRYILEHDSYGPAPHQLNDAK